MFKKNHFAPITLHRLNIQLWAVNNVLYDLNNSDDLLNLKLQWLKIKNY